MTLRLDFQREIFTDFLTQSGVLILAEGLGLLEIIASFLKVYASPKTLVLVINLSESEEFYIQQLLALQIEPYTFHVVDNKTNHEERVTESCLESFILKLYRKENQEGFIKAFSDLPESFTYGFSKLEKSMKYLHAPDVLLWPRFHKTISTNLGIGNDDEVIEIQQPLTPKMLLIQTAILDILTSLISELKRTNPMLDLEEAAVSDSFFKSFDVLLKQQLDLVKISSRTKQLISDIRLLRTLLKYLVSLDCVEFLEYLESSIIGENMGTESSWPMLDSADTLVKTARSRVYEKDKLILEHNPKWKLLLEILEEINEEMQSVTGSKLKSVLIFAQDEKTVKLLSNILKHGAEKFLQRKLSSYNKWKMLLPAVQRGSNAKGYKRPRHSSLLDISNLEDLITAEEESDERDITGLSQFFGIFTKFTIQIHSIAEMKERDVLSDHLPDFVILYEPALRIIRNLEVFRAAYNPNLRIYFVVYKGSAEEQKYLISVRKEKEAFEKLIKVKAAMASSKVYSKDDYTDPELRYGIEKKIIVDIREFRSSLPFILTENGIKIEPHTIEIGDYVLTSEICVERKSIPDLIGSFASGRLYYQCEAMCRNYKHPFLLIEFDPSKAFVLQSDLRAEISINDLTSKIVLLTLHFPKLEIIWSCSPHATAEIFLDVKKDQEEPNIEVIKIIEKGAISENGINSSIKDLLLKLPGVTMENYLRIMKKFKNIRELFHADVAVLNEIMGTVNANRLSEFVHKKI